MRSRNRLIMGLLIFGIVLFAAVQFIIIPHMNADKEKYLAAQQNPATHDLKSILKYKNKYMGNASNDINLFYSLPLHDTGMTFQLFSKDFSLQVNYKDSVSAIGESRVKGALIYNSTAAFALIDNLESITYNFTDSAYQVKRSDIKALYFDFKNILKESVWKEEVREKMRDDRFIEDTFERIFQ